MDQLIMDNNNVSCSLCNKPAVITDNKHNYCLDHYNDRKTLKNKSKKNDKDRNQRYL